MEELDKLAKIISVIITYDFKEEDDSTQQTLGIIHTMLSEPATIPYTMIAKKVYYADQTEIDSTEENELLNNNIKIILDSYSGPNKNVLKSNLDRIKNNHNLSIMQREFIKATALEAKTTALEAKATALEAIRISKEASTILEDIKSTKSSIYTDFIAILGVFSSFVFLIFGGINFISSIFSGIKDIEDLKKLPIDVTISISCIVLLGILIIMYTLLLWVSRMTGKNLGYCNFKNCTDYCKHKYIHAFRRHSFFFTICLILTSILISYNLKSLSLRKIWWFPIIWCVVPIILIIIIEYYFHKPKKSLMQKIKKQKLKNFEPWKY